jgi:hypothetical protein
VVVAFVIVGAAAFWISGLMPPPTAPSSTVDLTTPTPTSLGTATPAGASSGASPNHKLTPGVASADVTPANIHSTICVSGYTSGRRHDDGRTVRPPSSYTTALKREQIVEYGYSDTRLADYEEDHLIPLEIGGDGYAPGNLWPEPYAGADGARIKDRLENQLHTMVCDGRLGLRVAQAAIAGDWYTAYLQYG